MNDHTSITSGDPASSIALLPPGSSITFARVVAEGSGFGARDRIRWLSIQLAKANTRLAELGEEV